MAFVSLRKMLCSSDLQVGYDNLIDTFGPILEAAVSAALSPDITAAEAGAPTRSVG